MPTPKTFSMSAGTSENIVSFLFVREVIKSLTVLFKWQFKTKKQEMMQSFYVVGNLGSL